MGRVFKHSPIINVTVTTDDHSFSHNFDGQKWFWQAATEELKALEDEGFAADYTSDNIYYYFQDSIEELKEISQHLENIKNNPRYDDYQGFMVEVEAEDYYSWIKWLVDEYEVQSGNLIKEDKIFDSRGIEVSSYSLEKIRNYLMML